MRFRSLETLERDANRVLRAYWKLPDAQKTPRRIQPELLVTELLRLKVDYRHLSEDGWTLGLTSFDETGVAVFGSETEDMYLLDGNTILIEKDLLLPKARMRCNYTLMHEGCHHILNRFHPGECSGGSSARRVVRYRTAGQNAKSREEWQVNQLTSLILMPKPLLLDNMHFCDIDGSIPMLNPIWRAEDYSKFSLLADLMGVSRQAMSIRMKRLGLIGEDCTRYPNAILDIECEEEL